MKNNKSFSLICCFIVLFFGCGGSKHSEPSRPPSDYSFTAKWKDSSCTSKNWTYLKVYLQFISTPPGGLIDSDRGPAILNNDGTSSITIYNLGGGSKWKYLVTYPNGSEAMSGDVTFDKDHTLLIYCTNGFKNLETNQPSKLNNEVCIDCEISTIL